MKEIKLTDYQLKNLVLFLDRVECKGIQESMALVEIVQVLNKENDEITKIEE